ncbi:HD-GYP domain-containing protein [Virgibacillus halodenitrificans]|uniref:HD-GYP domain-containing protein n=1 Tax=Virgibacillus halodenitrificans TaxID=1482 RepID=UPI000EF50659|nr:HD-GYP domain-containing protein [Virgibacillus halodenitrificans]
MKLVNTNLITPGEILAQTVHNDNGVVLIREGVTLTEKILARLIKQGITYLYIKDKFTNDIKAEPVISNKLRSDATKMMKDIFYEIQENGLVGRAFILDNSKKKLSIVVNQILEEIQSNKKSFSLLTDIFITDNYVFQHSLNVAIYSLAIGVELNYSSKMLTEIGIGAMLHDIGKMFISPEILNKPGRLSEEEYETMKSHTVLGFEFLRKQADLPTVVSHCAYQHHERLDGSGYPRGIKDDDIHPYGKLIGIADVFDAVTSNRVYREAMLPHEGLEILYAGAARLFDKNMVEAFKNSVIIYPNGITVLLSNKSEGIVVRQNENLCDRPVIRIMKENTYTLSIPYDLDLGKVMNVTIVDVNLDGN